MKKAKTIPAIIVVVFVVSSAVFATVAWTKLFKSTYKPAADSTLAKAKCAVCHVQKNGTGGLNSYGKLLKGKPVTVASLNAIKNKDADGDTFSNIKEIKVGTLPGDSSSKPPSSTP